MKIVDTTKNRMKEIGYQTENNRSRILFDISDILSEFPGGTAALILKRPGDDTGFPARTIEMDGTSLVWTPTAYELAENGYIYAQIVYVKDDVTAKTKIYSLHIQKSLIDSAEEPEDWEDWVGELVSAAGAVNVAIAEAQSSLDAAVYATEVARSRAELARDRAETSQQNAEAARDNAQTAMNAAVSAKSDAQAAQQAAENARDRAESARDSAAQSAATAEQLIVMKGLPNGLAELDENGVVPTGQLPDNLNDYREYQRRSSFPAEGIAGVLYGAIDTNTLYRYDVSRRQYYQVGGGAGGTSNYNDLTGKPRINNVELSGNKTAANLGLASANDLQDKADKTDTVLNTTLSRGRTHTAKIGEGSIAFGENVGAYGRYSTALGIGTVAKGDGTVVIGSYDLTFSPYLDWRPFGEYTVGEKMLYSPDANTPKLAYECIEDHTAGETFDYSKWKRIPGTSEEAFAIGNGIDSGHVGNAMLVTWEGDMYLQGNVYVDSLYTGGRRLARVDELPRIEVATVAETMQIIRDYDGDEDFGEVYDTTLMLDSAVGYYYYVTEADAADIAETFISGGNVLLHFTDDSEGHEYIGRDELYLQLTGYVPEYENQYTGTVPACFMISSPETMTGSSSPFSEVTNPFTGTTVDENGKLRIYIDYSVSFG